MDEPDDELDGVLGEAAGVEAEVLDVLSLDLESDFVSEDAESFFESVFESDLESDEDSDAELLLA